MNFDTEGVHHITLRVADLRTSRAFYEGVLGLEVDQSLEDKCRLLLASGPDASRLVLRPALPGTPAGDRFDERRIGLDHIAIRVADRDELARVAEALRHAGIATQGIQAVPGGGVLVCFRDPDNVQLEFFAD